MKRIMLAIMTVLTIAVLGNVASAEEQVLNSTGTATIQITADIVSTFEVSIPDIIEITERKIKDFQFLASGNISQNEYLEIELPESVEMTAEGEEPIELPLTINKTTINNEELAAQGGQAIDCTVDATNLTSADWAGSVEINISLKEYENVTP